MVLAFLTLIRTSYFPLEKSRHLRKIDVFTKNDLKFEIMPAIEVTQPIPVEETQNEDEKYTTPVIGIIYPPPEVRSILLKFKACWRLFRWVLVPGKIL